MKRLLFLGFLFVAAGPASAEPVFQVDLISPSKEFLYVNKSWQTNADCVQAKVSVTSDVSGGAVLKAYFFSADGKLLHTEGQPTPQADRKGGTIEAPTSFEKGKKYQVFFGIPRSLSSGANKWRRVIVVFGKEGDFAAKVYPKDDLAKFDFPEKTAVSGSESSQ